jgi:hypothetical protein
MSAFLYGKLIRQQEALKGTAAAQAMAAQNKLVTTVAALIPMEIIALHGLMVSCTTTSTGGVTTITNPVPLQMSLPVMMLLSVVVFYSGRGGKEEWTGRDRVRALLPPAAVLSWTGLIGTSALSPWVAAWDQAYVVLGAGTLGVVLVVVSQLVNPPKSVG